MKLQHLVLASLAALSPAIAVADGGDGKPKQAAPKKRDWNLEDATKLGKANKLYGDAAKIYKLNMTGKQAAEVMFQEAIDILLNLEKEVKHKPSVDLILAQIYTLRDHPSKRAETREESKSDHRRGWERWEQYMKSEKNPDAFLEQRWACSYSVAADTYKTGVLFAGFRIDPRKRKIVQENFNIDDPRVALRIAFDNFTESRSHLEWLVKIKPKEADIWQILADVQARLGDLPTAMKSLRTYLALEPDDDKAYYSLIDLHLHTDGFTGVLDEKIPGLDEARVKHKFAYAFARVIQRQRERNGGIYPTITVGKPSDGPRLAELCYRMSDAWWEEERKKDDPSPVIPIEHLFKAGRVEYQLTMIEGMEAKMKLEQAKDAAKDDLNKDKLIEEAQTRYEKTMESVREQQKVVAKRVSEKYAAIENVYGEMRPVADVFEHFAIKKQIFRDPGETEQIQKLRNALNYGLYDALKALEKK